MTLNTQTLGTVLPLIVCFTSGNKVITRAALTDLFDFRATGNLTLSAGGTVTNYTQFQGSAMTGGTNRINFDAPGATTGTPTIAYGFRSLSHSVGTTRAAFWGDNQFFCDDSDHVCNTAGKGLVVKDAQGTPEFWRIYPSVDGATVKDATFTVDANGYLSVTRAASATGSVILNVQDTGTAAPTA